MVPRINNTKKENKNTNRRLGEIGKSEPSKEDIKRSNRPHKKW